MPEITETCGCGAKLAYSGPHPSRAAREFREQHKHAESVGICGDRPQVAGFPDHLPRPYCVLKAGHVGMHGDGDGGHWTDRPKITNEPTPTHHDAADAAAGNEDQA